MKRLFFILFAISTILSLQAETQKFLPCTYCGCTLGKTTRTEILKIDSHLPKCESLPWGLSYSESTHVYVGDFFIEGHHFSILTLSFYKDTLYKFEFRDVEINNDIMELNRSFVRNFKNNYSTFNSYTNNDTDEKDYIICSKTDSITKICIFGGARSLTIEIGDIRLSQLELNDEFASLCSYSTKTGPNYDKKNKVEYVAGVRFGETKTNTINAFNQRGTFVKNEGDFTYFSDVSFGGSIYTNAILYFQYDSRRYDNVFSAVRFEQNFHEWRKEEALMAYEVVCGNYGSKYTNGIVIKDEAENKMMVFGMLEEGYENGKIPPIIVSFELGVSKGGTKYYYVTVSYFSRRMSKASLEDL